MDFSNLKAQYKAYKKEIDRAVVNVMTNAHFILGPEVKTFEEEFKKYVGADYAVSCANGTDALHLALRAIDIKPGDEVIVPSFTFIATASTVLLAGGKPVFADIDPYTFNLDPVSLKKKITKKTKAVVVVHLFGLPADLGEIKKICKKHHLILIEDCAQAFGAKYKEKHVGTYGDIGCFSFFPAKNLGAYGDGGMTVTNKKNLAKRLTMLRFHGHKAKYKSQLLGFNSRLDTLQAAIMSIKLKHFKEELKVRREAAGFYNKNLSSPLIISKPENLKKYFYSFNYYTIRVKKRDALKEYLKSKGIPTMVYYPIPCHLQPALKYLGYKRGDLPVSEQMTKEVLSLPISGFVKKSELKEVVSNIVRVSI